MKWIFGGLALVFLAFFLLTGPVSNPPEIVRISPSIARAGELLTIYGKGFGYQRYNSFISLAGISPTSSAYVSWSDHEIVIRIPNVGEAALIRVHRGRHRSNPVFFVNRDSIPVMP